MKTRKKRRYSDVQREAALAAIVANNGSVNKTAKQLSIPEPTLRTWANGAMHPNCLETYESQRGVLADILRDTAHRLIGSIPNKIPKAGLKDTAISLGIAVEKMLLLEGKATTIQGKDVSNEVVLKCLETERGRQFLAEYSELIGGFIPPSPREEPNVKAE